MRVANKFCETITKHTKDKRFTLAGSNYCAETDKIANILSIPGRAIGFLVRNPAFDDAIDLFGMVGKQFFSDKEFIKLGVLGTNYAYADTTNGRVLAKELEVGSLYPVIFTTVQTEGVTKGDRSVVIFDDKAMNASVISLAHCVEGFVKESSPSFNRVYSGAEFKTGSYDLKTKVEKQENGWWAAVDVKTRELQGYANSSIINTIKTNPATEIPLTAISGDPNYRPTVDTTGTHYTKTQEEKKPMKSFNTMFSKFGSDFAYSTKNFAMSMFGGLAVKTKAGNFVTFNKDTLEAMDVMDMTVDGFEDFIMIMPTQKLEDGDLFVKNGSVFAMIDSDTNEAYSFDEGTIVTLMTVKNAFGFNMYAKVFNIMGSMNMGATTGGMFGGMNPMMMMMMMNKDGGEGFDMKNMMMMSMMSGGMKF